MNEGNGQKGEGFSRKRARIDYEETEEEQQQQQEQGQQQQWQSSTAVEVSDNVRSPRVSSAPPPANGNTVSQDLAEKQRPRREERPHYSNSQSHKQHHYSHQSRLEHQIEELESQHYLSPSDQVKLENLQDKLESITSRTQSSQFHLPNSSSHSRSDLYYGKAQAQVQVQAQAQATRTVNWEAEQFRRAQQLNLKTDDKIHVNDDREYEYVFDESQYVNYEEDEILSGDEASNQQDPQIAEKGEIEDVQQSLPVYKYKDELLKIVSQNQVLIVVGETGSGKTTQLPQYLYHAGYSHNDTKIIGCTQPRRVAATSVAQRVAQEMQVNLGDKVGYTVRFDDKSSARTKVKYLTDGMLLREFLKDPQLDSYGAIMIDEAHERTLSTEILLSLLKDLTETRKDLKIIIASATINATKFSQFFNNSPILNIPGRRFPVKIHYTKQPEANYLQAIITTIFQIHLTQPLPGDILVFLTGQEEIENLETQVHEAVVKLGDQLKAHGKLLVCSIYANLPHEQQQRIFEPTPPMARKLVLATNIAETSITIPGVAYVIDPGYVKQTEFNPSTGMESLLVVPCSRANCDQRAGRAGRIGPGKCFRIFTKHSFDHELEVNQKPEIMRINLNSVVLLLLSLGINDLIRFPFLDPPNKQSLIKSLNLLRSLDALNSRGALTSTGAKMSEFPLDPTYSKCILESEKYQITREICIIIAMLTESANLYYSPKKLGRELVLKRREEFASKQGDHFTLLNIYRQWSNVGGYSSQWCQDYFTQYKTLKRARNIYEQLIKICTKIGMKLNPERDHIAEDDASNDLLVQKCLMSGFFNNVVKLSPMGDCYQNIDPKKNKTPCFIHPSSILFKKRNPKPRFLMYYELILTSKEYMRNCLILDDRVVADIVDKKSQR
ncbi:uncharacterized protein LODBEIA_P35260 [Lodderomyces beijingensis]|uniref:RNA helicase n=1 Tax=Lodderomyces beijingensis TaxID=1775926 RepID=A0ABP0ZSQ3_9ASCO